ncbi:apoptosis-inducing factor 3-like [Glossina fuscipes]|uniref:Apoptosis-inducing factor 3-like n=1 Tax=Glossina fuscipes TaxID=7396 RepID=A0A9C5ZHT1_9MUSC|nr:apoptosis-inducing factor 3-like [Glossina fuscipes]
MEPFKVDLGYLRAMQEKPVIEAYTKPVAVCHAKDVREHEMKEFEFIHGRKVLIAKYGGQIHALGNTCTHYDAPLHTGVLGNGRIRCPWHGACFNIETGDIEECPGLDSLPCYKVEVERGGLVMVQAKLKDLESTRRLKTMAKRDPENPLTYVLVGGGPSSQVCAETLRKEGFTGRIVIVCKESYLPYDRSRISRRFDLKFDDIQYRPQQFYDEHNIEVFVNSKAIEANVEEKLVIMKDDKRLFYDKMYIATGSSPKQIPIKGFNYHNVFTMRNFDDWRRLKKAIGKNTPVICVGSSFLAMEIAQAIKTYMPCSVTVVSRAKIPMQKKFGLKIGERILKMYKEKMITMMMETAVLEVIGNDLGVTHVRLNDNRQLPCKVLIIAAGIKFNTKFLVGCGLPINANGSIDADLYLQSIVDDVYVGGDIANAPVYSDYNHRSNIGHIQVAQNHGYVAGVNMHGSRKIEVRSVPYYTTTLFNVTLRCSGFGLFKDVIIEGDLEKLNFVAYYIDSQDRVISVVSSNRDPIVSQFAEFRNQGRILRRYELVDLNKPWVNRLKGPIKCH